MYVTEFYIFTLKLISFMSHDCNNIIDDICRYLHISKECLSLRTAIIPLMIYAEIMYNNF